MSHNFGSTRIGLTADEITQLRNIDDVTISNAQWGYLGDFNQALMTSSSPQFASLTIPVGGLAVAGSIRVGGSIIPYTTGTNMTIVGSESANGKLILHSSSHATKGYIHLTETTESIDPTSGCLIISGGVGVAKNINMLGTLTNGSSNASTSKLTGAVTTSGGLGVAKQVNAQSLVADAGSSGGVYVTDFGRSSFTNYESFFGCESTITATASTQKLGGIQYYGDLNNSTFGDNITHVLIDPTSTINSNTTYIATMQLDEPAITVTSGTLQNTYVLYITGQATEGSVSNYAIYASGESSFETATVVQPRGLYAHESAPYTTLSSAVGGLALLVPLTEAIDPSNSWTVNSGSVNGRVQYTNSVTRYFSITSCASVTTSTGGNCLLTLTLQQDQTTGTWVDIPNAKADHYLTGVNDNTSICFTCAFQAVANTQFRLLVTSNDSVCRYTFNHASFSFNQML